MFSTIPEHITAFGPTLHRFKNSVAVGFIFFHSQPLTNGHFHFLTIMHLATTKSCFSGPTNTVDGLHADEHNSCAEGSHFMTSITCSGRWSHTGLVADSTIMRKCKWLFVNVPAYKSTFFTATDFLSSYRVWTSASVFWGIMLHGSYGLCVTTLSVQDRCNSACTLC